MNRLAGAILVASGNPHKLEEVRAILAPLGLPVCGLADVFDAIPPEPAETERTFAGNARLKAAAYARLARRACLADDSGLEVDALDGAPGVDSAIYAGTEGTRAERDARNNVKLLAALRGVPDAKRTARFICAMALADADGAILHETRGTFEGRIVESARGLHGFGYDPLFFVDGEGCTSAELAPARKNDLSHRGAAARAMADWLRG